LLSGKKALVIVASGGDYQGPAAAYEHAASHAKVFFGFLGMHVEVVAVPGQAGADAGAQKDAALAKATEILRSWK
jgi:FMN-dependent NADH-azoreductase